MDEGAYVDAPEFFYRVERDDFFKEVVPVVVSLYGHQHHPFLVNSL